MLNRERVGGASTAHLGVFTADSNAKKATLQHRGRNAVTMSDNEENNNEEPELEAWVRIQQNTFTNWVNDKLNSQDMEVDNIRKDFRDGVKLCKLAEVLVGRKIGKIIVKKNLNHYEASGNLALALQAMKDDGVRLVNIGGSVCFFYRPSSQL